MVSLAKLQKAEKPKVTISDDDADFALTSRDKVGGNSGEPDLSEFQGTDVDPFADLNPAAQSQLKSVIERMERLQEDKDAVTNDMKEVLAEAKGNGFDTKIVRKVLKIRAMDKVKRQEEEALTDLYLAALEEFIRE